MKEKLFKTFQNFSLIAEAFDGILLDAWGVFWAGSILGAYPEAKDAMEGLVQKGKIVGILSNATQLANQAKERFQTHGLLEKKHFHFLITSGETTRQYFLKNSLPFPVTKKKFYVWGSKEEKFNSYQAIFKNSPFSETHNLDAADFIYISVPRFQGEDQIRPAIFYEEIKKLKDECNLPMVCANPDQWTQEGNPLRSVVRQGSIAKIYEELGGKVFYFGKPYFPGFKLAMSYFCERKKMSAEKILMVGDNPETDIRGAKNFGMKSALVMETGLMADLPRSAKEKYLTSLSPTDRPDFLIKKFALSF